MGWCLETSPGGGPEVGVTRNDDPILTRGEQQKLDIFGSLEAAFEGVNSIMSMITKQRGQSR